MRPSLTLGYLGLTFAQVAISINVVTSKYVLATLPMFTFLTARFGISSLLLFIALKMTKTPLAVAEHGVLTRYDWGMAILQGIFAAFLFNLFFVWGLQHTTATAAGIISSTLPAIIAICAIWLLKERLNRVKILALGFAMLGILIINIDNIEGVSNSNHTYWGDFLVFVAMFPEAWYSIISRKLASRVTPLGAAFIANAVGFICWLPCALFSSSAFELSFYGASEFGLVFLAGLSAVIFFWCWGWGLSFISASTAAIFGGIMPVATMLFAIIFLNENLHWYDLVGMLFVMFSIALGAGWYPAWRKAARLNT